MAARFKDQVVVITGGGRGVGRAIALEFASEGALVVLAGRRMDALQVAAREVADAGGRADVFHCDVARDEHLQRLVGHTIRLHGKINVLVNNASAMIGGSLDELSADDVRTLVDVNLLAVIRLTQLVLPHMREAGSGTIVNIASLAAHIALPFYAAYSATKFGVRGFSEALRRELQPDGIQVIGVYPGGLASEASEGIAFDGLGLPVTTAEELGRDVVQAVRRRQREVFAAFSEASVARWNGVVPVAFDWGLIAARRRVRELADAGRKRAAARQTQVSPEAVAVGLTNGTKNTSSPRRAKRG